MRKIIISLLMVSLVVVPLMAGEYQTESAEFEAAFKAGNFADAVELATTLVGKGNALNAQGMGLYEKGDFKGAEKLFRAAIAADSEQYWAYNNLGAVLLYFGDKAAAVKSFEKSAEVNANATDKGAAARVRKAVDNSATARSL